MAKSTISMAIFNSYVKLPEGSRFVPIYFMFPYLWCLISLPIRHQSLVRHVNPLTRLKEPPDTTKQAASELHRLCPCPTFLWLVWFYKNKITRFRLQRSCRQWGNQFQWIPSGIQWCVCTAVDWDCTNQNQLSSLLAVDVCMLIKLFIT